MNRIYSKDFNKNYKKLDAKTKECVQSAIQKIPNIDYIMLKGNNIPPLFRIRVGKYRILFEMNDTTIYILKIDSRGDIYKSI